MNLLFLIQARTGSTRLPKKVLMNLWENYSLISFLYNHLLNSSIINPGNTIVLTTDSSKDDLLAAHLIQNKVEYYRGSETNVYNRFYSFLLKKEKKPDFIVRICADNPFIDLKLIEELSDFSADNKNIAYISHATEEGIPAIQTKHGFFTEFINCNAFLSAREKIISPYNQEHVTPFFYNENKNDCAFLNMPMAIESSRHKFSVDTGEDLVFARKVCSGLTSLKFTFEDVLSAANKMQN